VSTAAKALRDGRIDRLPSGLVDAMAADRSWTERTRLRIDSRVPGSGRAPVTSAQFRRARAAHETYKARIAKLEFLRLKGVLVNADDVKRRWFNTLRGVRDALLSAPDRIAPIIAGMSDPAEVRRIIESELRAALEPMGGQPD
jgi:hypothetical protein